MTAQTPTSAVEALRAVEAELRHFAGVADDDALTVSNAPAAMRHWAAELRVISDALAASQEAPKAGEPDESSRWVTQTTFYDPANPDACTGNCTESALASIFAVPLTSVPSMAGLKAMDFWDAFDAFVNSRGFWVYRRDGNCIPEGLYLASGPSSRGCSHMVVMENGKLRHDPHPSREGIQSVEHVWVLVPFDPAAPTPPASQGDAAPAGDAVRALVDEWSDDDTPILRGEAAAELREALKQSAPGTDVIRDMRLLAAVGIPVAPECVARWAESLAARCDDAPGVETVTDACLHTLRKTAALPDNAGWIAAVTPQDARAILAALAHAAPPEAATTACDPLSDRRITVTGQTKAEEALRAAHAAIRDRLFADSEREALTLLHRAAMRGLAAAPAPAVEREAVGAIFKRGKMRHFSQATTPEEIERFHKDNPAGWEFDGWLYTAPTFNDHIEAIRAKLVAMAGNWRAGRYLDGTKTLWDAGAHASDGMEACADNVDEFLSTAITTPPAEAREPVGDAKC